MLCAHEYVQSGLAQEMLMVFERPIFQHFQSRDLLAGVELVVEEPSQYFGRPKLHTFGDTPRVNRASVDLIVLIVIVSVPM